MLYPVFLLTAILQASLALPVSPTETLFTQLASSLPVKEIQELQASHLKNDPGFQAAIKVMKSPEWHSTIEEIRKTPEWIEYKNFVKEGGLDMDYFIQHLEHCVNNTDVSGFNVDGVKPTLANFIRDVQMTHGIQILKGVHGFVNRIEKSEASKKLREQMMNPRSKQLLENAMKQPALVDFSGKLQELGVGVDGILQTLYSLMEKS